MHLSRGVGWLGLGLILALPGLSQTNIAGYQPAPLEEPLVATAPTSPAEDHALLAAIQAYQGQASPDHFRVLLAFLAEYPHSGWRLPPLTHLGLSHCHYAHFPKAIYS